MQYFIESMRIKNEDKTLNKMTNINLKAKTRNDEMNNLLHSGGITSHDQWIVRLESEKNHSNTTDNCKFIMAIRGL